jgi:DNA-binding GntR family transcriptional regulator
MSGVRASPTIAELPRLDATSLQERVTDLLRERIVGGDLPGGTRLSMASLAAQLGVSRQPVASALQRLAHEGYVVIRPRSGTIVTNFDTEHYLQALDVRLALEELAAPLCVAHAMSEEIDALEAQLRRSDALFSTWERTFALTPERQRLAREFHEGIIALARHAPLLATYRFVNAQPHRLGPAMSAARMKARLSRDAATQRTHSPVNQDHHAMVRALRDRDTEALRRAFRAEVERVRTEMTRVEASSADAPSGVPPRRARARA